MSGEKSSFNGEMAVGQTWFCSRIGREPVKLMDRRIRSDANGNFVEYEVFSSAHGESWVDALWLANNGCRVDPS